MCGNYRILNETETFRIRLKPIHATTPYYGDPTGDLLVDRFGEEIEIVIPPPITAVLSLDAARDPTPRDKHIAEIRDKGRLAWQVSSGYNHRSDAKHK